MSRAIVNARDEDWVEISLDEDTPPAVQQALVAAASPSALQAASQGDKCRFSPYKVLYGLLCLILMCFYTLSGGFSMVMSGYSFYLQLVENETEQALAVALNRTAHAEGAFAKIAYPWVAVVAIFKALFHFINIYLGLAFLRGKFDYSLKEGLGFLGFFFLGLIASIAAGGMPTFANLAGLIMAAYAFGLTIGPGWTLSFALTSWIVSDVGNAFWFLLHVPMIMDFLQCLFKKGYPAILFEYREKDSKNRLMDLKGDTVSKNWFRLGVAIAMWVILALTAGFSYSSAYRVDGCAAPWSVLTALFGYGYQIGPFNNSEEFMDFYHETIGNKSYDYSAYSGGLQFLGVWNALLHWIRYNVLLLKYVIIPLTSFDLDKPGECNRFWLIALMVAVVVVFLGIPNIGSLTEGFAKGALDALSSLEIFMMYFRVFNTAMSLLTSDTAKLAVPMLGLLKGVKAKSGEEESQRRSCCPIKQVRISEIWKRYRRESPAPSHPRAATYVNMVEVSGQSPGLANGRRDEEYEEYEELAPQYG